MDKESYNVIKGKFNTLLERNMSKDGFRLLCAIDEKIPNIWNRPSSSTGKYHRDENGYVLTILEHTYEMVYAASNIMRCLRIQPKTREADTMMMGIVLHDLCKFGVDDPLHKLHTDKKHDRMMGNSVRLNKEKFKEVLTEQQVYKLEEMTRYHSGIWSTDAGPDFTFKNREPETFFVHLLDMLSTNNLLKIPKD
jgi:hypothetical protein